MKKKSKILSLLALGLTVPTVMLTGCVGGDPSHEQTSAFAHNDTHHWYKCACGENDCEFEYEKELHEFEELDRTPSGNTITVNFGCDCGEIKTENLDYGDAWNLLLSLDQTFSEGSNTLTSTSGVATKNMDALEGVARQTINREVVGQGFVKVVNDNGTFKLYQKWLDSVDDTTYSYSVKSITRDEALLILTGRTDQYRLEASFDGFFYGVGFPATYEEMAQYAESEGVDLNLLKTAEGYKLSFGSSEIWFNSNSMQSIDFGSLALYETGFNKTLFDSFDITEEGFNN